MLAHLAIAALVLAVIWVWRSSRKTANMPPGEWGWPVVGHFPPSDEIMEHTIHKLRLKYGDTFTWRIGARVMVVMCEYKTIRQVFNNPDVQDRPDFFSFKIFSKNDHLGLFNVNGHLWETSRRFTIRHLRDLGMGKSTLETAIVHEAEQLVEEYRKHTDKPTQLPLSVSIAILNIIWKMTSDIRFKLDDPEILKFQGMVIDLFKWSMGNVLLFDMFPYLIPYTPRFVYKMLGVTNYMDHCKKFTDYIHSVVMDHKKTLDEDNPRDFIDQFLIEQKKESNKDDPAFTDDNLDIVVSDIFLAGSESTSINLRWILLYMAAHPEVQAKVQAEIDEVVQKDRLPGLQDRPRLNYTEAVFHEVQRVLSFTNVAAPHVTTVDLNIDGYTVPKGTILYASVSDCHKDPKYWEKPNEFYPQHFLDQDGKFKAKKEGYAPFSVGRRVCPGENLAKLSLFLFGSALLQNFTFSPPEGVTFSTDRDPKHKTFAMPKPVEFIIKNRA